MYKNILVSLLLFAASSIKLYAQKDSLININGTIQGLDVLKGSAIIVPIAISLDFTAYHFDSLEVTVTNNHFHFSGYMLYPHCFYTLAIHSPKKNFLSKPFFLEPGNISLTCFYDSSERVAPSVKFSKTNDEYQLKFLPAYNYIQSLIDSSQDKMYEDKEKYNGKIPDSIYNENQEFRKEALAKRNVYLRNYIKRNPTSYIPLALIGQSVEWYTDNTEETEKTFDCLSDNMKNTISGIKIKAAIKKMRLDTLAKNLANGVFIDSMNNQKSINYRANQFTLVDFWFSNCKPCVAEFPELKSVYKDYQRKGFNIISLSSDENNQDWKNALLKYNMPWQQLWDKNNLTGNLLLIYAFPSNFLIDKNGNILERDIDPDLLNNFLNEHLK